MFAQDTKQSFGALLKSCRGLSQLVYDLLICQILQTVMDLRSLLMLSKQVLRSSNKALLILGK